MIALKGTMAPREKWSSKRGGRKKMKTKKGGETRLLESGTKKRGR